jgi:ATP-dependent exoDNAse (exonuclease V) alpha subunit
VHKSQGSQAPAVVVVLHRGHDLMLTRNLLYTAVTRAERACVVVGERAALQAALRRRDAHARHTRLAELVAATRGAAASRSPSATAPTRAPSAARAVRRARA